MSNNGHMKIVTPTFLLLSILSLAACGKSNPASGPKKSNPVGGPEFDVKISLSNTAKKKLTTLGENIKVIAYFDGDSRLGKSGKNTPMRDVYLGEKDVEIEIDGVAHFRGIVFSGADYNELINGQYVITLNTVSGRRAYRDNLLDCADPMGKSPDTFNRKTVVVSCKLIGEQ